MDARLVSLPTSSRGPWDRPPMHLQQQRRQWLPEPNAVLRIIGKTAENEGTERNDDDDDDDGAADDGDASSIPPSQQDAPIEVEEELSIGEESPLGSVEWVSDDDIDIE